MSTASDAGSMVLASTVSRDSRSWLSPLVLPRRCSGCSRNPGRRPSPSTRAHAGDRIERDQRLWIQCPVFVNLDGTALSVNRIRPSGKNWKSVVSLSPVTNVVRSRSSGKPEARRRRRRRALPPQRPSCRARSGLRSRLVACPTKKAPQHRGSRREVRSGVDCGREQGTQHVVLYHRRVGCGIREAVAVATGGRDVVRATGSAPWTTLTGALSRSNGGSTSRLRWRPTPARAGLDGDVVRCAVAVCVCCVAVVELRPLVRGRLPLAGLLLTDVVPWPAALRFAGWCHGPTGRPAPFLIPPAMAPPTPMATAKRPTRPM